MAVAAVAVTAVDVVAVVVVTVVAVIAITIVTSVNHAGSIQPSHGLNDKHPTQCLVCKIRGYFLASGFIFRLSLSVPRITSIAYSSPAFISPSAAV